jgi:hypothetical protein
MAATALGVGAAALVSTATPAIAHDPFVEIGAGDITVLHSGGHDTARICTAGATDVFGWFFVNGGWRVQAHPYDGTCLGWPQGARIDAFYICDSSARCSPIKDV